MAAGSRGPAVRSAAIGRVQPARDCHLIARLDEATLQAAVGELASRDADLAAIVARIGPPPRWDRPPGFGTLVHIVLEQQVSLASARAAFDRLVAATDPLTPERFLGLGDDDLLAIGFSRQKARYTRGLAAALVEGSLELDGLTLLDDDVVRASLEAIPGIGPWTSTIYLLMVLGRPDVWPAGDMALATAIAEVRGLPARPGPEEVAAIGEGWRPWRSVAARLLWHHYLACRHPTVANRPHPDT